MSSFSPAELCRIVLIIRGNVIADTYDFVITSAAMAIAFATLLRRIRKRDYPTVSAFADALRIAPSQLSRAMSPRGQPFDIAGCLRLAKVSGIAPEVILRAAGKTSVADLLTEFYGPSVPVLSEEDRRLLDAFHQITNRHAQLSLLAIVDAMRDPHHMPSTSAPAPVDGIHIVTAWQHDRQGAG